MCSTTAGTKLPTTGGGTRVRINKIAEKERNGVKSFARHSQSSHFVVSQLKKKKKKKTDRQRPQYWRWGAGLSDLIHTRTKGIPSQPSLIALVKMI